MEHVIKISEECEGDEWVKSRMFVGSRCLKKSDKNLVGLPVGTKEHHKQREKWLGICETAVAPHQHGSITHHHKNASFIEHLTRVRSTVTEYRYLQL